MPVIRRLERWNCTGLRTDGKGCSRGRLSLSLLSVQNEGGVFSEYKNWRGFDGRRSAFVWACVRAAQSGARLLYDQLGTARAHLWPMSRPSGVWIHGIEVWTELRADRLKAAKRMNYILANSHFTQHQAIRSDKTFSHARVCWLATLEDDVPEAPADLDGAPARNDHRAAR